MTADLSPDERATVERFEAAPAAEESLRVRVARAIWDADAMGAEGKWARKNAHDDARAHYYRIADAAIDEIRGASDE